MSRPPDPDLILVGVQALRPSMREVLGHDWTVFSQQLDSLFSRAVAAAGVDRKRLVDALVRFGLDSPAEDLFRTILSHATSPKKMQDFLEHDERTRVRVQYSRGAPPSSSYERVRTHKRHAGGVDKAAFDDTESDRALLEEAAFERESGFYRGRASAGGAAPTRARPERTKAARPRAKSPRPKAKRPSRPKAKRASPPRAMRLGRTKAKRASRPQAKSAGRRAHPTRTARRAEALPSATAAASEQPLTRKRNRFVNLHFASTKGGQPIAAKRPLVANQSYRLLVNIGERERKSIIANAAANPLRDDLLPPSTVGHWLQAAVASKQFHVPSLARWLFLPEEGPAWACKCKPGGEHTCEPRTRQFALQFPIRSPRNTGEATLRVTIYFEKSILQSILVAATIARTPRAGGTNRARVDYNLTQSLKDVELVQPRALSIMMNDDDDDASHTLVFNGAPSEIAAIHLSDHQLDSAVRMMRAVMRNIHIDDTGPNDKDKKNRFDTSNRKSLPDFIADLKSLAVEGYTLWTTLWGDRLDEWTSDRSLFVEGSDAIHVGRKQRSPSVFPWAMVYDIPIDSGDPQNNHLCELLEKDNWAAFQKLPDVPARCPHENTHGTYAICPYGFWGFRYEIELPPSLAKGGSLKRTIPVEPPPLTMVIALSEEVDLKLRDAHLKAVRSCYPGFTFRECRNRKDIITGLGIAALDLVYFYCHGNTKTLTGNTGTITSLGVGNKQTILPPDLIAWRLNQWPQGHWATMAPLVFINGCHTADTTPQTLVNFVDTFSASLGAAGVIGTEITVHQLVANEVGESFLKEFQLGHSVGKALRQARGSLLKKGNLLGLVYTAYCSADLQFAAVPGTN